MTPLRLTLKLDGALGEGIDLSAIGAAAQAAAQDLCARLGIPAEPTLTVERAALPHGLAALSVEGAPCRHADSLESQLFAAHSGALYAPLPTSALAQWLRQQPERMPSFFGAFVQHALSDQAAQLLTEPVLAAYRDQLPEALAAYPLSALYKALAPLLASRLSLRDVSTIAAALQESSDERGEALLARLRPQQLAIRCSAATLRALTESAGEDERALFSLMREGLFEELGIRLPSLTFALDEALPFNQFALA
ncbi:MAG: hypothetical protein ACK4P1_08065, partial [Aggregatilineales bacterium]